MAKYLRLLSIRSLGIWNGRAGLVSLSVPMIVLEVVARSGTGAYAASATAKERAAKTACLSGDYAKGVALLAELYVKTNDINYLFNQGRCFEQNAKYEEAIARFREYERKSQDAGRSPDEQAARHIADCQTMIDRRARSGGAMIVPTPATPAPGTPVPSIVPAAAAAPPFLSSPVLSAPSGVPLPQPIPSPSQPAQPILAPPVVRTDQPNVQTTGRGLRVAGSVAVGMGLVSLLTGAVYNLRANNLATELTRSSSSYSREKESRRAGFETVGWLGYGIGGGCMATGILLYYLGHQARRDHRWAATVTASPGLVQAALEGAF